MKWDSSLPQVTTAAGLEIMQTQTLLSTWLEECRDLTGFKLFLKKKYYHVAQAGMEFMVISLLQVP